MDIWEAGPDDGAGEPEGGKRERLGGRAVIAVVVGLVVLLGAGYVGVHQLAGDKVPRGTTISGVDVGGLSRAAAIEKLEKAFGPRAERSIAVSVNAGDGVEVAGDGQQRTTVTPADLGMSVDYDASVDAAGAGSSWSPGRQWDYFTGGGDHDAVVHVDGNRLDGRLADLAEGMGTPPKDGQVRFTRSGVTTVDPVPGEAIDLDAARAALTDAFLSDKDSVDLEVSEAEPDIDADDVEEAVESFANPAMANAVTLVFGKSEVRLQPRQFAKALSMKAEDGELVPDVDEKVLSNLVKGATTDGEPIDATVKIVKNKPRVVPAKPGVEFRPADVAEVFSGLLTQPDGKRKGKVKAKVVDADFTTKDAKALKITEKISEFQTRYPHADYRNVNIGRAAELIDGTVLKPGEEFSLNDTVGERTADNGFTSGYIISNGVLKLDYGGGVSQMATTLFNAMFFAGLKDVEHKPHSFYIDRYPVGREATVAWPTVDLRFENDSPYGVLVRAWIKPSTWSSEGVVTVQMWSTKVWDIKATKSGRYAYVGPGTRTLSGPDCEPHTGWSGFQIDVTRIFRKAGESAVDHTEKFHTNYTPSDSVVCKAPPPPKGNKPKPGDD